MNQSKASEYYKNRSWEAYMKCWLCDHEVLFDEQNLQKEFSWCCGHGRYYVYCENCGEQNVLVKEHIPSIVLQRITFCIIM